MEATWFQKIVIINIPIAIINEYIVNESLFPIFSDTKPNDVYPTKSPHCIIIIPIVEARMVKPLSDERYVGNHVYVYQYAAIPKVHNTKLII